MHLEKKGVSTTVATVVIAIIVVAAVVVIYYLPELTGKPTTTTTAKQYKLALVVGGDETDAGFSANGIEVAQWIHAYYGWSVSISRDVSYSDQSRVITTYAQEGYDVVWTHGNQFIGVTEGIAAQYPNVRFVLTPSFQGDNLTSNIVGLDGGFQVTGYYQAGVLAGKMTTTNAVAVVIGQWFPSLSMEFYAFKAGVLSANTVAKVYARVPGTWADPSVGLSTATALINTQHVDIIAAIADATGRGVFTAAQQYNISVIGTVQDQAVLAPYNTMTSVLMNSTAFMQSVIQHILGGTWSQVGGKVVQMNLGLLAPFHNFDSRIPTSVKTLLAQTAQGISSGTINVPYTVTENPPADPA